MSNEYELPDLNYHIENSNSSGNCVIIEDMMVDIGLSYKRIEPFLKDIKYIFITHTHGDHLKTSTYWAIRDNYPNIIIMGNLGVYDKVDGSLNIVTVDDIPIILDDGVRLTPFDVQHSVQCQGFTLNYDNGSDIIYVTDSAGTADWKRGKYDYLFLESNHCEYVLNTLDLSKYNYNVLDATRNHTSQQESRDFYLLNRKDKKSKWVELHKSSRFYRE